MDVQLKATNQKTKDGKASVPSAIIGNDVFSTGYISVQIDGDSIAMEVEERYGAGGNQVWVSPNALDLRQDVLKDAKIAPASEFRFRTSRLFKTKAGLLAFSAFLAAVIGAVVKLSFTIGETGSVIWIVQPQTKSILIWLSSCLEIIGLGVLFVRGTWLGIK